MSEIDYQAHNFTCYTVPECSSSEDDHEVDEDDVGEEEETETDELELVQAEMRYDSYNSLHYDGGNEAFDNTILRNQYMHQKYHRKHIEPYGRISMPSMLMTSREMTPQLGAYHDPNNPNNPAQLGYFVPLGPNCYFSPPMQRRRFRYTILYTYIGF